MTMTMTRVARLAWLLLPLLGWLELGAQRWTSQRAPRFSDYAQLTTPVRALAQPGDVILVAPEWAEPAVRRALGDGMMPLADLGRADLSSYARAVEISSQGARAAEARGWEELRAETVGPFTLRLLRNPRPQPTRYDFLAHAPEAEVPGCAFSHGAALSRPTFLGHPTLEGARFRCGGEPILDVSATTIDDERARPRRCLWAATPPGGERVIRFHDVPLGDRIDGHTAIPWLMERDGGDAPVALELRVDGERLGAVTHRAGDGWSPFSFALGAHAGATATVELRVRSRDASSRPFCFEARAR